MQALVLRGEVIAILTVAAREDDLVSGHRKPTVKSVSQASKASASRDAKKRGAMISRSSLRQPFDSYVLPSIV
jgi:hypothetical protein